MSPIISFYKPTNSWVCRRIEKLLNHTFHAYYLLRNVYLTNCLPDASKVLRNIAAFKQYDKYFI